MSPTAPSPTPAGGGEAPDDSFARARATARPHCPKCRGTGTYMYDDTHGTICDLCCTHSAGWWKLEDHYGAKNGKWCCGAGCGAVRDDPPSAHETLERVLEVAAPPPNHPSPHEDAP